MRTAKWLEEDLVKECEPLLAPALGIGFDSCTVARELATGANIADLVFCQHLSRAPSALPRSLTTFESCLLSAIRREVVVKQDDLQAILGIDRDRGFTAVVSHLKQIGLVKQNGRGELTATKNWQVHRRVFAVEAKLSRWREALDQAISYTQYADYSFVLLPDWLSGDLFESKHIFVERNIGLLLYDGIGVTVVHRPRRQLIHNWRREFVLSRLSSYANNATTESMSSSRMGSSSGN